MRTLTLALDARFPPAHDGLQCARVDTGTLTNSDIPTNGGDWAGAGSTFAMMAGTGAGVRTVTRPSPPPPPPESSEFAGGLSPFAPLNIPPPPLPPRFTAGEK